MGFRTVSPKGAETDMGKPNERMSITQRYYSNQKANTKKKVIVENIQNEKEKPKHKLNTKTKYLDCFDEAQKKNVKKFIKKQGDDEEPKQNPFKRRKFSAKFYTRLVLC